MSRWIMEALSFNWILGMQNGSFILNELPEKDLQHWSQKTESTSPASQDAELMDMLYL